MASDEDWIFQFRKGTPAQWAASTYVLRYGEPGIEAHDEPTPDQLKFGDGVHLWEDLSYVGGSGGGGGNYDQAIEDLWEAIEALPTLAQYTTLSDDLTASILVVDGKADQTALDAVAANLAALSDDVDITFGQIFSLLAAKADASALTSKADLVAGVIPTSQIPALALTSVTPVASRAAMLALTNVQPGDVAVITAGADKGSYILGAVNPAVFANWQFLETPTSPVTTVNGQIGNVVVGKGDVGLGNATNTADADKIVSGPQQTALNLKANQTALDTEVTARTNADALKADQTALDTEVAARQNGDLDKADLSSLAAGLQAGEYCTAFTSAVSLMAMQEGSLRAGRLIVGRTCTLNQIACEVTVAGAAGSVIRLVILLWDPVARTASLMLDAGTVDSTTTGLKTITISQAVTKGQQLLLAAVTQGAAATRPTIRSNAVQDMMFSTNNLTNIMQFIVAGAVFTTTQAGAIPSNPGSFTGGLSNSIPRVAIRAA